MSFSYQESIHNLERGHAGGSEVVCLLICILDIIQDQAFLKNGDHVTLPTGQELETPHPILSEVMTYFMLMQKMKICKLCRAQWSSVKPILTLPFPCSQQSKEARAPAADPVCILRCVLLK